MNWRKAETSKMCPVMSSELRGNIYFGSYACLKCDYNLGYDKEAGLIKCAKESSLKPEKTKDLREQVNAELRAEIIQWSHGYVDRKKQILENLRKVRKRNTWRMIYTLICIDLFLLAMCLIFIY